MFPRKLIFERFVYVKEIAGCFCILRGGYVSRIRMPGIDGKDNGEFVDIRQLVTH